MEKKVIVKELRHLAVNLAERHRLSLCLAVSAILLLTLWLAKVQAFPSYHDPDLNDEGYCSQCHTGFTGGQNDTLHSLHTGGDDPVTENCDLCHTGSGRNNPLIMWSKGDDDDGRGCMGCHGRDYGEIIFDNYNGLSTLGKAKSSGYGLRKHHRNADPPVNCTTFCHPDDTEPFGEDILPLYYARPDVSLGGMMVDSCFNEDSANDADSVGLDNDGDYLYDENDPDCAPCIVEYDDFALFALEWQQAPCDAGNGFCNGADFDQSGAVGIEDLLFLVSFWFDTCPQNWLGN